MFRLGITASNPASFMKLKPHRLKYVWNGSGDDPGHLEKPPVTTSCVSNKYLEQKNVLTLEMKSSERKSEKFHQMYK